MKRLAILYADGGMHGPPPGLLINMAQDGILRADDIHPAAVNLRSAVRNGKVHLICNTGYTDPVGSHFESEEMLGSTRLRLSDKSSGGWLAKALGKVHPNAERIMAIGVTRPNMPTYFEGGYIPAAAVAQSLVTPAEDVMDRLEEGAVTSGYPPEIISAYIAGHNIMRQLGEISLAGANAGERMAEALAELPDLHAVYGIEGGFDLHKDFLPKGFASALAAWDASFGALAKATGLIENDHGEETGYTIPLLDNPRDYLILCETEFCRSQLMTSALGLSHGRGSMKIIAGHDVIPGITGTFPLIDTPDGDARLIPGSGVPQHLPVEITNSQVQAAILQWMDLPYRGIWVEDPVPLAGFLPPVQVEAELPEVTPTELEVIAQLLEDLVARIRRVIHP